MTNTDIQSDMRNAIREAMDRSSLAEGFREIDNLADELVQRRFTPQQMRRYYNLERKRFWGTHWRSRDAWRPSRRDIQTTIAIFAQQEHGG